MGEWGSNALPHDRGRCRCGVTRAVNRFVDFHGLDTRGSRTGTFHDGVSPRQETILLGCPTHALYFDVRLIDQARPGACGTANRQLYSGQQAQRSVGGCRGARANAWCFKQGQRVCLPCFCGRCKRFFCVVRGVVLTNAVLFVNMCAVQTRPMVCRGDEEGGREQAGAFRYPNPPCQHAPNSGRGSTCSTKKIVVHGYRVSSTPWSHSELVVRRVRTVLHA